jgi:predicted short-subunit dehydrogenase-like oxidoreductase (DUF2520 family)
VRRPEELRTWAEGLGMTVYADPSQWPADLGWVFLAVPDAALSEMPALLQDAPLAPDTVVWHAAGAVPLEAIGARADARPYRTAVAWPMMSFAGGEAEGMPWEEVPWSLEGEDDAVERVRALLEPLGGLFQRVDREQRKHLHLAAVWANNFPAYCFGVAAAVLRHKQLPQALMLPIIRQSAQRLDGETDPFDLLTGPALRRDRETMQAHLALLEEHPEWAELYRSISAAIADTDADRQDAASDRA